MSDSVVLKVGGASAASIAAVPAGILLINIGYALGENDDEVWSARFAATNPFFWLLCGVGAALVAGLVALWVRPWRRLPEFVGSPLLLVFVTDLVLLGAAAAFMGVMSPDF